MSSQITLLVLGLGNVLCSDDGVGPVAVHALAREYCAPDGARVVDGGTLGLSLLPLMQEADSVLMVDAIRCADLPPGSLVRLEGEEVAPAARERLSPHQIGVADLLDGASLLGCAPETMILLGLVPQTLALGLGLSPAIKRQMPALTRRIIAQARALGYRFRPRPKDEKALRQDDACDMAAVLRMRG